jgi:tRNA nucleotidyltransferase (CCA-adding enzyme)
MQAMDVITTHVNADFDCLGSMVAAGRLYPGALLCFPGSQEKGLRDFITHHPDYLPPLTRAKDIDLSAVTRLIIVDCQQASRIGRFAEIIGRPGLEVHIYDHHPVLETSIPPHDGIIRPCGAVSSIMAGLLRERGISLSPEEATLVMLGIHEDTGRLSFLPTTAEDYLAAAWLLEQGARLNIVSSFISQELTTQQVGLLNTLLKNLKTTDINGVTISITHASSDSYIPDIAGLAHLMRDMENLDALFLVVAMESRTYLVARSRIPEVNVGEIMRRFQGGGHATAASAAVHDLSLKQVLNRLDELLRLMVTPQATAGEIMSSPVKSMPTGITIAEARDLLTRYNCNAMPVMDGERMAGILSRKIVEKALYHDLGQSPATEFMHTEFMRATPDTLLSDIQEYLVEGNRRFVPVFEGEELVGAVTRTDLLRHMYGGRRGEPEALYDLESLEISPRSRSIAALVNRRLPAETIRLLHDLGRSGDELGLSVYAVGGFVRDLLLGVENLDLDLTVEGDGIFFAEKFAAAQGGRVRSHPTFGTAVVILPDGRKLDVASTRLEYYESPGVLPTVERSSLRHDLYRRDFTINTLAICINGDNFGMITDFFGGQQDILQRTVRVLHNLSFVEDPTRVFRAIRFEQRLAFRIAPHTENLIRSAVRMRVLDRVGGIRLYNELVQILNEQETVGAVRRMAMLGLLPFIHPHLRLSPETERVITESSRLLTWFRLLYLSDPCQQWQVYFLALCERLRFDEFEEACQRLSMPGRIISHVFSHRRRGLTMLETLQRHLKRTQNPRNSEIYDSFHGMPLEILLYLAARTQSDQVRRLISLYITRLRHVHRELDGNALRDLGLAPGPHFSPIMKRLLAARLDGEVNNAEEERNLARSLVSSVRLNTPQ